MSSPVGPAVAGSHAAPIGARREPGDDWEVVDGSDPVAWDRDVVASGGAHPLQVWAWGEARESCGDRVIRLRIIRGTEPALLAQVILLRRTPLRVPVAWIARGPVWIAPRPELRAGAVALLKRALAARGAWILVARGYVELPDDAMGWRVPGERAAWTYRLDLTQPLEVLEQRLHHQWRSRKNRFIREGGRVVEADRETNLERLIHLRDATAHRKGYVPYGDAEFVRAVWGAFRRRHSEHTGVHLFQAELDDRSPAAAIVLRVGSGAHFIWSGFDYAARFSRVSEGLQWGIVECLRAMGITHYDLEGADPRATPGVFEFKKRMGGDLVRMPRTVWAPLARLFPA